MDNAHTTKKAEAWWDSNPFTYNGGIGVGKQIADDTQLSLEYFDRVEKRFRKHSGGSLQEEGKPLFSKFIDYEALRGKRVSTSQLVLVSPPYSTHSMVQKCMVSTLLTMLLHRPKRILN